MEEVNFDLLEAMRAEVDVCLARDDEESKETAASLMKSILEISFPIVEAEVRESPELLPLIRIQSLEPDSSGDAAKVLLKYLERKGIK